MTRDTSVQDGTPVECYKFISPLGVWRYTSNPRQVVMGGELYEPLQITRTSIEVSSAIDSPMTMDFNIPADTLIAQAYCFEQAPDSLRVEVRRGHRGDDLNTQFTVEWVGEWAGSEVNDMWATIETASLLQTKLNGNTSSVIYQRICNHILFDERCQKIRSDYTWTAVVTRVREYLITVDDDKNLDNYYNGGEIVNQRTGEKRSIVSNVDSLIVSNAKFFDLQVGDVVELTPGCDHIRLGDCKFKYDNVNQYGGFDFIPTHNPFTDLPTQSWVTTEVKTKKVDETWIVPVWHTNTA